MFLRGGGLLVPRCALLFFVFVFFSRFAVGVNDVACVLGLPLGPKATVSGTGVGPSFPSLPTLLSTSALGVRIPGMMYALPTRRRLGLKKLLPLYPSRCHAPWSHGETPTVYHSTQDNTPPWTNFLAYVLDSEENDTTPSDACTKIS